MFCCFPALLCTVISLAGFLSTMISGYPHNCGYNVGVPTSRLFVLSKVVGRFRSPRLIPTTPIAPGSPLPVVDVEDVTKFSSLPDKNYDTSVSTAALFGTGRSVLFGVPGAFTPTCSDEHLPGFVDKHDVLTGQLGVDRVVCMSVNDRFVLSAWNATLPACAKVTNEKVQVRDGARDRCDV